MSPVLVDQVVGAVCVLAELAGRRGSKRPGIFSGYIVSEIIFLGVYSIGESRELMNRTSLTLLQFVFFLNSRNSDRRDIYLEMKFVFFLTQTLN